MDHFLLPICKCLSHFKCWPVQIGNTCAPKARLVSLSHHCSKSITYNGHLPVCSVLNMFMDSSNFIEQ